MLVSAAFTPPNKVDLQFHGYLGVTCTSASAVDVTAAVTITGQDNSTLPSYIKVRAWSTLPHAQFTSERICSCPSWLFHLPTFHTY